MQRSRFRLKRCRTRRWAPFLYGPLVLACLGAKLAAAEPLGRKAAEADGLPRVFLIAGQALVETRRRVAAGDGQLADALNRLRDEAQTALRAGPFSVTDKKFLPPSGDKHDYMSLGPYWWPDPDKPDGRPYIRRDGEVNPEGESYDRQRLDQMASAVETLAFAYFLYSTMNLRGMFDLAVLGQHVGVDLWNFQAADGRGIRRALDWLLPFATGEKPWPHQQIRDLDPQRLAPLLRRAAAVYHEPRYARAAQQLAFDPADRMQLLWP